MEELAKIEEELELRVQHLEAVQKYLVVLEDKLPFDIPGIG